MKKLFVGVSALALVLTLGACGKKNTKSTSTQSTPTSETTSQGGTTSTTSQGGGTTSTTSQGGSDNKIYINLGSCSTFWGDKFQYTGDGGGLFAYFFTGETGPVAWPGTLMTQVTEHLVYSVDLPTGVTKVIFNMNSTAGTWLGDTQTEDIDLPTDGKNLFTINTENSGSKQNGTWSTYSA